MVKCSGFLVHFDGDSSVGIFDYTWTISGDFEFEVPVDMDIFKRKICEAFEFCSDTPIWIESFEERSDKINKEIAHLDAYHSV